MLSTIEFDGTFMIIKKLTDAIARYVLTNRFKSWLHDDLSPPTPATLKNKGSRQGSNKGGVGAVTGSLLLVGLVMVGILFFLFEA